MLSFFYSVLRLTLFSCLRDSLGICAVIFVFFFLFSSLDYAILRRLNFCVLLLNSS